MSSKLLIEYCHPVRKNVHRVPIAGKKKVGAFLVKPGNNVIDKLTWEAVKENPGIKALLADEYLKVLCEQGEKIEPLKGARKGAKSEFEAVLESFSVIEAKKLIDNCNDVVTLIAWRDQEKSGKQRPSVLKAIDGQLANIDKQIVQDENNDEEEVFGKKSKKGKK